MRPAVLALMLAACSGERAAPPRAQALVHIDTDAPVPRLANRLRITILNEALEPRCSACVHEVSIDDKTTWPLSFGVEPGAGRSFVRAQLFFAGRTTGGVPRPETAVDLIAELRMANGVVAQDLFLPFDCAGIPPDAVARTSCGNPIGALPAHVAAPSRVGSFHQEVDATCSTEARGTTDAYDGETCIHGGVFWFGDFRKQGFGPSYDAVPERAVAVRPFFLDNFAYSVGRYRAAYKKGFRNSDAPALSCFDGSKDETPCKRCALYGLGAADPIGDAHALNCLSHSAAQAICAFEGKRLATEAEWEWAGGSRTEERLFSWGNDDPIHCKSAEEARDGKCLPDEQWDAMLEPRWASPTLEASPYDRTTDGVFGMSYGLSEWVADAFQPFNGPCWTPGSYGVSPHCDYTPMPPLRRSRRGTARAEVGSGSFAIANRHAASPVTKAYFIGFRCARDDS
jgi:formylglycine-generating enzyme required for sulfatase activity